MDLGMVVLHELLRKVAFEAKDLVSQTNDVMFEKESFREFSKLISQLSVVFEALHAKRVGSTSLEESTKAPLETLHSQLNKACNIIKDYKSGSKLRFMLNSDSVLKQMQELAKEIASTISLLELTNIDATLYLKSETDKIISNLRSIEFSSTTTNEAIASKIDNSMASHVRNRDHSMTLLRKIAEACGTSVDASLVQNELSLLKQEKEEMEAQKKQAEALQLSQLIKLLYSSDMVPCPPEEEFISYHQNSIESFTCPLCNQVMTDPVVIVCGHSFERKAIQEHFGQGEISCPTCKQNLPSFELTPNISLRGSIEEWKQREEMDIKFQSAISGITSTDDNIAGESLENLRDLMEMPHYRALVSEKGLISKFVPFLKLNTRYTPAALKCLYYLSCHCDENKEIMIKAGTIRYIVKCFYKRVDSDAIAILLELSTKETLAEEIGNTKDCIHLLVSMLHNDNDDIAQTVKKVLENLSSNIHFVIRMAEAGYFQPFVSRFNEGTFESRASMAAALVKIQIGDNIKSFQDKEFICKLVEMLSPSSPAYAMACLKCMKKLSKYPEMVGWFLEDTTTIPHLIGLISFVNAETHWKLETTEVLKSLVENLDLSDFQKYPDIQDLQSQYNVSLFMSLVTTSEPQLKVKFLQLLIVLTQKSEIARSSVRSNEDAVNNLFCSLNSEQADVRQQVMKLIYSLSENHPAGVPLPPAPAKESAINALVAILNSSADNKERSTAAGIISCLPTNDIIIDEILHRSEVLKAIQTVLSSIDDEHCKAPHNSDESLLENVLAVLLHCTDPSKPELQKQVCELELYPSLVRILSRGSSLTKEYAATALAHLSQSTNTSSNDANIISKQSNNSVSVHRIFCDLFGCFSAATPKKSMCSVHGSSCSSRNTLCLIKADAVRPLVQTLSDTESGAAEAAVLALNTMLKDNRTVSRAATVIVENQGVAAILEVLERGTVSTKDKALDLFHKIVENTKITNTQCQRAETILIHLLTDDALRKKTAMVLKEMNILPNQSSYF